MSKARNLSVVPNQTLGMKNRIINGAMVIDQRNAGASITPAAGAYTVDRWQYQASQASKFTFQQNAGSVTPPAGFVNYAGLTTASAVSVGASDYFYYSQPIEGFNVADLDFGKSTAKTITLSFWVRSSLTGTFGGAISNSAVNRSYPFTYTISSANTWTQASVTIAGDTTGTWLTTNGVGMYLFLGLGVGSTYSGTAGSWAGSFYASATGATSVVGTNGATFYITGVQLEVGSSATGYEYRQYQQELALCQRYYWQRNSEATYAAIASGGMNSTIQARVSLNYPMPMRATPTISITNVTNLIVNQAGDLIPSALSAAYPNSTGALLDITVSGGTLGRGCTLIFGTTAASIQGSSEL